MIIVIKLVQLLLVLLIVYGVAKAIKKTDVTDKLEAKEDEVKQTVKAAEKFGGLLKTKETLTEARQTVNEVKSL